MNSTLKRRIKNISIYETSYLDGNQENSKLHNQWFRNVIRVYYERNMNFPSIGLGE